MLILLPREACGQAQEFAFDANGNLLLQTTEITAPPQILSQPQLQVATPGVLASFFVIAANTRELSYQWRINGANLTGATNDTLLLQNVGATNEGQYSVVLANNSGSVTSAPAALLLDGDRDGLPDSWELANFGNSNQYPTGDADGDGVSNRNEFLDGTNPADSASVLFRLTVSSDGGQVTMNPNRFSFTNGEMVTLTAAAIAPNTFHGWTGDTNTISPSITLVMTTNRAVFAHLGTYDITWTNTASGDWNVASNWSPNFVPGTNDNVFLTRSVTVTLNSNTACGSLTFTSGTLTGGGTLTLHRDSVWSGGTMTGSARTIIAPGATLSMNGNSMKILTGGRILENGGTTIWNSGTIQAASNTVITNRPGALFLVPSAAGLIPGQNTSRFDNAGTFRKTSAGTTTIEALVSFNNYGTVEIASGVLSLAGGGLNHGAMEISAGATLNFVLGTFNASAGSSLTGNGNLTVTGTTVTLAGLVNVSGNNLFAGGTANLTGNYICTNTLTISSGTANFNGTGIVAPSVLNQSNGVMGGSQAVSFGTVMNWTGGSMTGVGRTVIPPGASLNIANTVSLSGGRTLENQGTVLWTGGNIAIGTTVVVTNLAGALFEVRNAPGLNYAGNLGGRFDNAGTFRKSVSAGTLTVFSGMTFNNYGAVEIQTGTLSLAGGGTHTGSFEVSSGTTLSLAGGTHTASVGSSITGAGNLTVASITASLAGLVNVSGSHTYSSGTANLTGNYICTNNTVTINATANFSGTGVVTPAVVNLGNNGTLSGNNTVTVQGAMAWTGGTMTGVGRTVILPGVTLTIGLGGTVTLSGGRVLDNGGTTLWSSGNIQIASNTLITNRPGALFLVQSAGGITAGQNASRFDNAGTFRKTSAATTTVNNLVSFNNYGAVELQSGILAANGGYTSTTNALLHCSLGGTTPGAGYGRLQVAGAVTLNGALSVTLTNGFVPAINDSFPVLTAGTRNGTFANFYYPSNDVIMCYALFCHRTFAQIGVARILGVWPDWHRVLWPNSHALIVRLRWRWPFQGLPDFLTALPSYVTVPRQISTLSS